MAAPNVPQIQAELAKMPDAQLQQYAAMHKTDPYTMSLAMAEFNRRKEMRGAAQAQGGQPQAPKVADQAVASMGSEGAGIAQIPTPGVAAMAGGGIVAFAEGGTADDVYAKAVADAGPQGESLWDRLKAAVSNGPVRGRKQAQAATVPSSTSLPAAAPEPTGPTKVYVPGKGWLAPEEVTAQAKAKDKDTSRVALPAGYPAGAAAKPVPDRPDAFDNGIAGLISRVSTGKPVVPQTLEEKNAEIQKAAESDPTHKKYMEMLQGERGTKEADRKEARNMALLQAGLATMGGTSQHALVNIGAGGQQGIKTLLEANKEDDANRRANTKAQMDATNAQGQKYTSLSKQVADERIAQGQQDVAKAHFALSALIAKQNKTPAEMQIVRERMRDPAFAAEQDKMTAAKAAALYGPRGASALQATWSKDLMLQQKYPTFSEYVAAVSNGTEAGGGGGGAKFLGFE